MTKRHVVAVAGRLVVGAALFAGCAVLAQTATQAVAPGQAQSSSASGPQPLKSTQPGQAGAASTDLSGGRGDVTRGLLPLAPAGPGSAGQAAGVLSANPGEVLTLDRVLALAFANEPAFASALAASKVARLDRSIARAALLPQVVYHNQYLFTESSHLPLAATNASTNDPQGTQVFIANNAVHEYVSQGQVTETLGLQQYNALARADAAAAIASAELEVSRRGLTATVVGLFYSSVTAQGKVAIEERALGEAADFVKQTQQREAEREVAHADVLKAQLTLQGRQRDLAEARLMVTKAKLDLAVLLFADPRSPFSVTLPATAPLPDRSAVEAAAGRANPELASVSASLRFADLGVTAAKAALAPDVVLNYSYGIDATHFAAHNADGSRNLGYSATATVDVPVFDWFATPNRIKQARILRDAARVQLSATQRRLLANLEEFYGELSVAHDELDSLAVSTQDSRESLRLTRLRYSNGEATVLDVVDAQNTLTAAELAQQDGTVRYHVALANLETLTGTL